MQQLSGDLARTCECLLHEPKIETDPLRHIFDRLQQDAANGDRPWMLWDTAFNTIIAAAADAARNRCGITVGRVVAWYFLPGGWRRGCAAARFGEPRPSRRNLRLAVARVWLPAAATPPVTIPAGTVGNWPDCVVPAPAIRGTALAGGLTGIPTEALAAIAGHHAVRVGSSAGRRVDCLVAVVSQAVESHLSPSYTNREHETPAAISGAAHNFRTEVLAAVEAELVRGTATKPLIIAASSDEEFRSIIPAPRFLRSSSRSLERATARAGRQ